MAEKSALVSPVGSFMQWENMTWRNESLFSNRVISEKKNNNNKKPLWQLNIFAPWIKSPGFLLYFLVLPSQCISLSFKFFYFKIGLRVAPFSSNGLRKSIEIIKAWEHVWETQKYCPTHKEALCTVDTLRKLSQASSSANMNQKQAKGSGRTKAWLTRK